MEYPPELFVYHFLVSWLLLNQPLLKTIVVSDWNWQERDHYDGVG